MIKPEFKRVLLKYVLMIGCQCFLYDVIHPDWPFSDAHIMQNIIVIAWVAYIPVVMLLKGVRAKDWDEVFKIINMEARDIPWNLCYIVAEFACYYINKGIAAVFKMNLPETVVIIFAITGCAIFELIEKDEAKKNDTNEVVDRN